MINLAIFAGGRGTRLFGPSGGVKALVEVAPGVHLIDYLLSETAGIPIDRTAVLVRSMDTTISDYFAHQDCELTILRQVTEGTGEAVRGVLSAAAGTVILSTCDIFGHPDSLRRFIEAAIHAMDTGLANFGEDLPRCVIAVSAIDPNDVSPIYVDHDSHGTVNKYGKFIPKTSSAFGSIRIINERFRKLMLGQTEKTDTEMMAALLQKYPGSILAIHVDGIFDVDDASSLQRATTIASSSRHLEVDKGSV